MRSRHLEACEKNCELIKGEIDRFRLKVPLLSALRNPGMHKRHWDMIYKETGFLFDPHEVDLTLEKALARGLEEHAETVTRVCEVAGKEYALEESLNKMEQEWKEVGFRV
jgi:dynein heavy chain